jgi:soluble cytochrome b562
MNKKSLIECLDHIDTLAHQGNNKAIILTVQKLKHCIMQCDCDFAPDYKDFPAILREPAI